MLDAAEICYFHSIRRREVPRFLPSVEPIKAAFLVLHASPCPRVFRVDLHPFRSPKPAETGVAYGHKASNFLH